jgi:hypothetical protein
MGKRKGEKSRETRLVGENGTSFIYFFSAPFLHSNLVFSFSSNLQTEGSKDTHGNGMMLLMK